MSGTGCQRAAARRALQRASSLGRQGYRGQAHLPARCRAGHRNLRGRSGFQPGLCSWRCCRLRGGGKGGGRGRGTGGRSAAAKDLPAGRGLCSRQKRPGGCTHRRRQTGCSCRAWLRCSPERNCPLLLLHKRRSRRGRWAARGRHGRSRGTGGAVSAHAREAAARAAASVTAHPGDIQRWRRQARTTFMHSW